MFFITSSDCMVLSTNERELALFSTVVAMIVLCYPSPLHSLSSRNQEVVIP